MSLPARQKAVKEFERKHGAEPRGLGNRPDPDRFAAFGAFLDDFGRWQKTHDRPKKRKTALDLRIEKFHADCKRLENDRLQKRIRRLREYDVTSASPSDTTSSFDNSLDARIAQQISTQHGKYHPRLRLLYNGFISYNALYFGNRLELPIIVVNAAPGCVARCSTHEKPTVIEFNKYGFLRENQDYLLDVLLHEMCHAAVGETRGAQEGWGTDKWQGHHETFAEICNAIAKRRGWPDCSEKILSGRHAARHWPGVQRRS